MRRRSLLPLALLAASPARIAADACTALPFKTLSHSCGDVCPTSNYTCVVYAAAERSPCSVDFADASPKSSCVTPSANKSCVYQCFEPFYDSGILRFYITFNTSRSTRAPTLSSSSSSGSSNATSDSTYPPYETNEFVRRIGVLDLPTRINQIVLSGGRNEDTGTRGQVVDLEIDPAAFSKVPDMKLIAMMNIDLGRRLPDFPEILPAAIPVVDVTNANLKEIPSSIARLTELDALSFQRNYLTEVPVTLNLPKLKTLAIGENLITTFDATFPSLEFLDLADNKLQQFPSVVFTMKSLNTLKVNKNPDMATVIFSVAQYEQLSTLEQFSIDADAMDNTSCTPEQVKTFRGQSGSVCVVTDEQLAAYNNKGNASTTRTSRSNGLSTVVKVVIVVAAVLVAGGGAFGFATWKRRSRRDANTTDESEPGFAKLDDPSGGSAGVSGSSGGSALKKTRHAAMLLTDDSVLSSGQSLWDDDDMVSRQLQLEDIEDVRVIGSGGFAIVWLVRYLPTNRLLASKRLIKDQVTRQKTLDFVMEIKLNMQLVHPKIVQLVGVAWTIETDLQALLEYMPNGDLRSFLEASQETPTSWYVQKLQLAIDIVEALVYVHSFSPPLVHRDLKSRNILLADDLSAKVCDFGVSRFVSDNGTMTTGVGTGKWLAPEVIAGSKNYDASCDIYAFGVIMTELDTHRLPYDDLRGPQGNKLPEVAVLQMVASGLVRPSLGDSCPLEIARVVSRCLSFEPTARPSAMDLAHVLESIRKEMSRSHHDSR